MTNLSCLTLSLSQVINSCFYLSTYFKRYSIINSQKKHNTPINQMIKANEVMLINSKGEKQGIVSILKML